MSDEPPGLGEDHRPELPVLGGASREELADPDLEERRERRSLRMTAVMAGVTGGVVGFPLLFVVAQLVGWEMSHIPGWAGIVAWVVGSMVIGGYLVHSQRD